MTSTAPGADGSRYARLWIKLSTLAVSTALSVTVGYYVLQSRESGASIVWVESDAAGAREALREGSDTAGLGGDAKARSWRYFVPEAAARKLMGQLRDEIRDYDPYVYFSFRKSTTISRFSINANKMVPYETNVLGLMGPDPDTSRPHQVLVAGDSHVEGGKSRFPGIMSALLEEGDLAGKVEIVNAAHGAYSFFQYLGILERSVDMGVVPDVLIVTVFGGNDFKEALLLWDFFDRGDVPKMSGKRLRSIQKAGVSLRPAFGQALMSVEYFHQFPEAVDEAVRCAVTITKEIEQRCDELGVDLIIAFIPSPAELPEKCNWALVQKGMDYQGLEQVDVDRLTELRTRYLAELEVLDSPVIDLHDALDAAPYPVYFAHDLHLSPPGQKIAADLLLPLCLQSLVDKDG